MKLSESTQQKYNNLKQLFDEMESVLVAYSGGVDSSLLLKIGTDVLKEKCWGVIGFSPSLAEHEYQLALEQADLMGAKIKTIQTKEIENALYVLNDQQRCYFCKSELFDHLNNLAMKLKVKYIVEGSNQDDLDDYRPGMKAATDKKIRSPLVEAKMQKNEIRELAKYLELVSWNKLSQPCLSSRVAYGVKIQPEVLKKINRAEIFVKSLNFEIVRVRYFGKYVSVEVGKYETENLLKPTIQNAIKKQFDKIGFKKVVFDPEGYQSGKLNKIQMAS